MLMSQGYRKEEDGELEVTSTFPITHLLVSHAQPVCREPEGFHALYLEVALPTS